MSEANKREQEIDAVLAALRKAWTAAPELRLGQVLIDAKHPPVLMGHEEPQKLFYIEDQKLAQCFDAFYLRNRKMRITIAVEGAEALCLDDSDDRKLLINILTDAL